MEDFANYWNMFFVTPLGFLLHKFVNHSSRISAPETNVSIIKEDMQKMDILYDDIS
ncbi:MAG: hypothetical protein OEL56_02030 [Nitrosopumilus sp.]|nr:hypothetical protein [Nitrosopumilus sp.]MDH3489205.1 hypothetical protein [Nitrosopumilus sp.]MDH3516204.1 hypothetical protein [Nitrosopumilus sp.]MDH3563969.1 hypothetical protein [Nitrosopumilus sp.]MDH5417459.1 hypothetical protein [Nitrosopumilus sp.]